MTADAPDRVWAVDFQFDVTTDGRPIKIVSIVDEHTRECLGGLVERSITGEHLIAELRHVAVERGSLPLVLRCDNGPELELACAAMAEWAHGHVGLHFIPPGEPTDERQTDQSHGLDRPAALHDRREVLTSGTPRAIQCRPRCTRNSLEPGPYPLRGAYMMTATPSRQMRAPVMSHRSGRNPSRAIPQAREPATKMPP